MTHPRWIFGYGSLLWRPDFRFTESAPATLAGFTRRFWQGSPDHRGVPAAPGRVVTLIEDAGAHCRGLAFRVEREDWEAVLERLDERESGGFERLEVSLELSEAQRVPGLVYVASPGNPNFLGPASVERIAQQVRACRGRSGPNLEYVLRLADALEEIGCEDEHVRGLVEQLAQIGSQPG